jgi:hypothetical protein
VLTSYQNMSRITLLGLRKIIYSYKVLILGSYMILLINGVGVDDSVHGGLPKDGDADTRTIIQRCTVLVPSPYADLCS